MNCLEAPKVLLEAITVLVEAMTMADGAAVIL